MGRHEDLDPHEPDQIEARKRFGSTAVLRHQRNGAVRIETLQATYQFRTYYDFKGLDLCALK